MTSSDVDSVSTLNPSQFQPGVYKIFNFRSGTVLDLCLGDNRSIQGYPPHEGKNQQWRIDPLGSGHSICSVSHGLYMTVEAGKECPQIILSTFPVSWQLEFDEGQRGTVHILWPYTSSTFDLHCGMSDCGTPVHLLPRHTFEPCQMWRLVRCIEKGSSDTAVDVDVDEDTSTVSNTTSTTTTVTTTKTTTTTTTTTKVVRTSF